MGLVVIDEGIPFKCGITTLVAFIVLGGVPVIPYIIGHAIVGSDSHQFIGVVSVGVLELMGLGMAKGALIGLSMWKSGIETLLLGSLTTALGYAVGILIS